MKKLAALIGVLTMSSLLVGCAPKQEVPPTDQGAPVVQEEPTTLSLAQKIEDFSGYTVVDKAEEKAFVPVCDDYTTAFAKKVTDGEVKKLALYASDVNGGYNLNLYATPNYDKWTAADFTKVSNCGELGSVVPLKVVGDNVIWGYPYCSAGAVPAADETGYKEYTECSKVETQLKGYFGL